jgi:hypothetical protein
MKLFRKKLRSSSFRSWGGLRFEMDAPARRNWDILAFDAG